MASEVSAQKSISKNVVFKFLLNIFNIVVPILTGPYVNRVLGPELIGKIGIAESWTGYFYIFATFGIYQYGLREISKVRDDKEKLSKTFTGLFVFSLITNIVTAVAYIAFTQYMYGGTSQYVTSMILTGNLLCNVFYTEWANEALENYDFITIKTIVIRVANLLLLFGFIHSADNYTEYLWLLVAGNVVNYLASFIYLKRKIKFNFKNLEIVKHIKPMALVVILANSAILYTQLDKIMISRVMPEETGTIAVGFYYTAQRIMSIINTMTLTLIHVTIPRLNVYSEGDDNKYLSLLNSVSKIYFLILFPAAIGMFCLSPEIIYLYGGREFAGAVSAMKVFSLYMIIIGMEGIISNQIIYIKRKERDQVFIIFSCGVLNVILNVLLIYLGIFTIETAIFTTVIANTVSLLVEYIYVKKKIKLDYNPFSFDKIKYLYLSLVFIPITIVIKAFVSNLILIIILVAAINSLIYFGILIWKKDETTLWLIEKFLSKVKR